MTIPHSRLSPAAVSQGLPHRAIALAERIPLSLPLLLARIGIAAVFFRSGLTKLDSWPTTVMLFEEEYDVPILPAEMAAQAATLFELACPVLLVAGLATRLAALPLLAMTIVIQLFVYPTSWIDHTMWASLLVLLIARGPGMVSIDWLIARQFMHRA
ncbi:MAG: DoxX family protein [Dongiaceae bacterium]